MDGDPNKQTQKKTSTPNREGTEVQGEEASSRIDEGDLFDVSDVLSAAWLRCLIQIDNGSKWFLLGSRRSFLLYFRLFLVSIYIAYTISK
jgi:hypothetical protein